MPDHRIRLRGGWEYCQVGSHDVPGRFTLPTRWGLERTTPLRLTRRFGCPPLDPRYQVLVLLLEQVPGIHSIRLNDRQILHVSPDRSSYQILLEDLPARNVLVIEVEPRLDQGSTDTEPSEWGFVALVIQTRRQADLPPEPI